MEIASNPRFGRRRRIGAGARSSSPLRAMAIAGLAALAVGLLALSALDRSAPAGAAAASDVRVLVAGRTIPRGATARALVASGAIRVQRLPAADVRDGALASVTALRGKVAATEILAGEQLAVADFGTAGDSAAARIDAHQRAMTVSVDFQHGQVGVIRKGDRVDLYGAYDVQREGGGPRYPVVRLLARDVAVLEAAQEAEGSELRPLTLRISDQLAPRLAFTAEYGKVWAVLRPAAGASDGPPAPVDTKSILLGGRPLTAPDRADSKGAE